jgi:hypothetical protein
VPLYFGQTKIKLMHKFGNCEQLDDSPQAMISLTIHILILTLHQRISLSGSICSHYIATVHANKLQKPHPSIRFACYTV